MTCQIVRCFDCLGSGRVLPTCAPWDKVSDEPCPTCAGNGYPGTVRLKTLSVGDKFQDVSGAEFVVVAKDKDGCRVAALHGSHDVNEYAPHNPAVRVI